MPISTVRILKYVQQCYMLSGFELYPRWVPLYNMQFAKYKDNLKQTWKLTGALVKRKTKGQTFPTRITHNNRTFTQNN